MSLCVIVCGLWYSMYTKDSILVFARDEKVYYNNVKSREDFINRLNMEKIVDINTADAEALTSLNGIGPKTAEKIIEYRNTNGLFESREEIMNVKGIGESTFEKIKDYISIEGES